MEVLKLFVGAITIASVALIFVYYLWTKCRNYDRNTLLNKAIGVFIGVAIVALCFWAFS